MTPLTKRNTSHGFTIVELLIVIVVIGVLAAITIVAYNGIQKRARTVAATAAVDAWEKWIRSEIALTGTLPKTNSTYVCLTKSEDELPETSDFARGTCVTFGTEDAPVFSYNGDVMSKFQTPPPDIDFPTSHINLSSGESVVSRAPILMSYESPGQGYAGLAGISWYTESPDDCGRGEYIVGDPNDESAGGACTLSIYY